MNNLDKDFIKKVNLKYKKCLLEYGAMTLNERLFLTKMSTYYDEYVKYKNKKKVKSILIGLEVDKESIVKILNKI